MTKSFIIINGWHKEAKFPTDSVSFISVGLSVSTGSERVSSCTAFLSACASDSCYEMQRYGRL